MPKAYSLDLRERVAGFVNAGHSRRAAAGHFGVSASFVVRLVKALQMTGRLDPRPAGGRRHSKLEPHRAYLLSRVAEKADITMPELASELSEQGCIVAPSSISRWFIRNGYRFKKNAAGQRTRSPGCPPGPSSLDQQTPTQNATSTTQAGFH